MDHLNVTTQQTTVTSSSNINVAKMSISSNTSISMADIEENASKAIVGVVSCQVLMTPDFFSRQHIFQIIK